MKLANTTAEFDLLLDTPLDRVKAIQNAGFTNIDLSFYTECRPDSVYLREDWRKTVDELKAYGEENGVHYAQAHCAPGNPLSLDENYDLMLRAHIRSLEVCGLLGIPNTVIHAGWAPGIGREEFYERNLAYIRKLIPALEETGVTLCVENSSTVNRPNMFYFVDGGELARFLEYVDHPLVRACWDTGHANMEGPQYEEIVALGDHLRAVHINDNFGKLDDHVLPFMGTVNMDEIMNALLDVGFKGCFTFECDTTMRLDRNRLYPRRPFPRDTRLASPNLAMCEAMVRASFEIGRQILLAYGCYEE